MIHLVNSCPGFLFGSQLTSSLITWSQWVQASGPVFGHVSDMSTSTFWYNSNSEERFDVAVRYTYARNGVRPVRNKFSLFQRLRLGRSPTSCNKVALQKCCCAFVVRGVVIRAACTLQLATEQCCVTSWTILFPCLETRQGPKMLLQVILETLFTIFSHALHFFLYCKFSLKLIVTWCKWIELKKSTSIVW